MNIPWRLELEQSSLARAGRWGEANDKQPLKLGVFWTDGVAQPHPPITRGLRIVAQEVKKAGHKVCSDLKSVLFMGNTDGGFTDCRLGAAFARYSQESACEYVIRSSIVLLRFFS